MAKLKNTDLHIPANMRRNWGWLLALGILFVILGSIGFVGLGMVGLTLASMFFLGILLLAAGLFQLFDSFKCKQWSGLIWHLGIGVLYLIGGGIVLYDPILASAVITAILAAVLIVIGMVRLIMALMFRNVAGWGWMVVAGLSAVILGILILVQWPWSGLWFIGLFISIEMLLTGWTYILIALAIRK